MEIEGEYTHCLYAFAVVNYQSPRGWGVDFRPLISVNNNFNFVFDNIQVNWRL